MKDRRTAAPFTAGIRAVRPIRPTADRIRPGSYQLIAQSPKPMGITRGPPRRYGPQGQPSRSRRLGTTQGPHSTLTPETLGWGDGSTTYSPCGVRVCPPWPTWQAGRWHGPCARAANGARAGIPASLRGRTGSTRHGDSASIRTRNPPHPSQSSRRAHQPEAVSASGGRRRHPPTGRPARPRAEEFSASRVGRMSIRPLDGTVEDRCAAHRWPSLV